VASGLTGKSVIFSGIQPSGSITIGNYIGAIRHFKRLQEQYDCLYCVVDLHALTVRQDPAALRGRCVELIALYIACGLDPDRNILYCQSHVPAQAELAWVLNCFTYMGELNRMTQFKEKSRGHADNINAGLYTYPVLMASDILLYRANLVPVGEDQKQHLEICRNIAQRFNNLYGDVFIVPEPYIPPFGARVMSLTDPTRKMSKSDAEESYIALTDAPDAVVKKIKRSVTDSDGEIRYDTAAKPGVSNLLTMICALEGGEPAALAAEMAGQGYGALKARAAECVNAVLAPIQAEYTRLLHDKGELQAIIRRNAGRAVEAAAPTMRRVYEAVGCAAP